MALWAREDKGEEKKLCLGESGDLGNIAIMTATEARRGSKRREVPWGDNHAYIKLGGLPRLLASSHIFKVVTGCVYKLLAIDALTRDSLFAISQQRSSFPTFTARVGRIRRSAARPRPKFLASALAPRNLLAHLMPSEVGAGQPHRL